MNNMIKSRLKKKKHQVLACPNCGGTNIIDITNTIRGKKCMILDTMNISKIIPLIEEKQRLYYCQGKAWRPFKQSNIEIHGMKRMKDYIDCDTEFLITYHWRE